MAAGIPAASSPAVTNPALAEPLAPLGVRDKAAEDNCAAIHRPPKAASGVLSAEAVVSPRSFSEIRKSNAIAAASARFNASMRAKALVRPRPLPEPFERSVIDRDNAYGLVNAYGRGFPPLVLVEDQVLHHDARRRADHSSEQRQRASGRRGQCIKSGLACPSHAVLAARQAIKIEETTLLSSGCFLV